METSFEAIPVFMGRPAARCEWDGMRLSLNWDVHQREIFDGDGIGRQLSPEIARDLLQNLRPKIAASDITVREVAAQNLEASIMARTKPERLPLWAEKPSHRPLTPVGFGPTDEMAPPTLESEIARADYDRLRHHIARLSDYMIRAQQIITLMAAAKKISPEMREAMRRVDWPIVQEQFPVTVEECYQIFRQNRSLPLPQEDHHV